MDLSSMVTDLQDELMKKITLIEDYEKKIAQFIKNENQYANEIDLLTQQINELKDAVSKRNKVCFYNIYKNFIYLLHI